LNNAELRVANLEADDVRDASRTRELVDSTTAWVP
jgi:hypothetical protein